MGDTNDVMNIEPTRNADLDDDEPTSKWIAVPEKIDDVVVVERRARGGEGDRLEVRLGVGIESESNFYIGCTENLSDGGVFVATHSLCKIGCRVDLVIALRYQEPIRAKVTVRWLRPYSEANETQPGMGIRFDSLSDEDAERIHEFAKCRQPMFYDDEGVFDDEGAYALAAGR